MPGQISYSHEILRKLIHLSSLWMVVSLAIFPRLWNVCLFAILLAGLVIAEYGNHKKWPVFSFCYGRFFNRILREKETSEVFRLSGAPYVLAAALMVSILFEQEAAMIALSTMLIGDTFAALIGRKWGKHKINAGTKSVEGAIAFWISSACVLAFFVYLYNLSLIFTILGAIGLTLAMFAEIYEKQIRVDDNFSIPLITGAFLSLSYLF